MCTAEEKFFTPLSAAEYRLLDVLCTLSTGNEVEASMAELARYSQTSEESVRRALRKLEQLNLVETVRTKRNLGKLSYSRYTLISPSHKNVGLPIEQPHKNVDHQPHKNVGSTASNITNSDLVLNKDKTTSYLLGADAPKGKRRKLTLVNRWQDDDNDIAGFGLFDNEVIEKVTPRVRKNDTSTRTQRPKSEWTPWDVAAEFESRVRSIVPVMAANAFSIKDLAGALAKQRKASDISPLVELELMDMFFEDPWVRTKGKESPGFMMGRYLKSFTIHFNQALRNLNMTQREAPADISSTVEPATDFVYASDGRRFDNSMPGRLALERYEEKLRRKNGV